MRLTHYLLNNKNTERGHLHFLRRPEKEQDLLRLEDELSEIGRQIDSLSTGENKKIIDKMRKLEVEIERAKDRISDLNTSLDEAQADLEFNEDEIERVDRSIQEHQNQGAALSEITTADEEIEKSDKAIREAKEILETGSKIQLDLSRAQERQTMQ